MTEKRGTAEILLELLIVAKDGIGVTAMMKELYSSHSGVVKYISLLRKMGLLESTGKIFQTTSFYDTLDREALPAALGLALGASRRPHEVIELDLLDEMCKPVSVAHLRSAVELNWLSACRTLEALVQKGFAVRLNEGRYVRYQISSEGRDYVRRVDSNLKLLTLGNDG